MKTFHIVTISNDSTQYAAMKNSFLLAGFTDERCQYTLFENYEFNKYEPYTAYNSILSHAEEPYVIFCHQDIRLDQGSGLHDLTRIIRSLDIECPHWDVLGNAGTNDRYFLVANLKDPHGTERYSGQLPCCVHSLDENFLVVKNMAGLACSTQLSGFHLYGTDLCLQAISKGMSCFVIDFTLTHLSGGNHGLDQLEVLKKFQLVWNRKFTFTYVGTCNGIIFLSKYKLLQYLLGHNRGHSYILRHRLLRILALPH